MGRRFSIGVLIGLAFGTTGGPATLDRLDATTLQPTLVRHVANSDLGFAWARSGSTLAVVLKPVATGQPVRLVDARTLRTRRTIQVGDRDVCGLTYLRGALVALASDRPCYWQGGSFSVLRFSPTRLVRVTPVRGLHTLAIPNLAFGDGKAFVARVGGEIDVVDLTTGSYATHRPRRTLAKGERILATRWLGDHRLGVGPDVVNVRTWRSRRVLSGATGLAAGPNGSLAAWGLHGVDVFFGARRMHVLGDEPVSNVHVVGWTLYANVGAAIDLVDLRSTKSPARVAATGYVELFAP